MTSVNIQKILIGTAALIMIIFAVPRFIASVWMAVGDPIYKDIQLGKPISEEDLALLIESREVVLGLVDYPIAAEELAVAYMASGITPENMEKSIAAARKSVEWSPLNAFSWNRLASYLSIEAVNHTEGAAAWFMTRQLAEHEPYLLHPRIHNGIRLYRALTPEQRELLRTDIETAYRKNRNSLRQYGRQNNLLEWFKYLMRDEEKTAFFSQ